jgi:flagellar assembly protein FliH
VLEGPPVATTSADDERAAAESARIAAEAAAQAAAAAAREEGYAAGFAEAHAQLEPARTALLEAAATLQRTAADVVPAAERRAVELALTIAEKIVTQAVEADPELVSSVVAGALRRAIHSGPLVLEVNPADVDLVKSSLDEIARTLGGLPKLELVGERRVSRGGCVIRTADGEIDARLETQLERAATVLS